MKQLEQARAILVDLLEHLNVNGFKVIGYNDGEDAHAVSDHPHIVHMCVNELDQAWVIVKKGDYPAHWILFIACNGVDAISDYGYSRGDPDGFADSMDNYFDREFLK